MTSFKEIFQTDKVGYKGHISYNLHNHTEYSDGEHSVEELIKEAKSKIITHLSINDHDNILAYTEGNAIQIGRQNGIHVTPGTEATVGFENRNVGKPHILLFFKEKLLENIKFLEDFDDTIGKARGKDFQIKKINKLNKHPEINLDISDFDKFLGKAGYNGISSRHFRDLLKEKYNFSDKKIKEITGVDGEYYIPPVTDYKIVKEFKEKYDLKSVLAHPICDFHTQEQIKDIKQLILDLIGDNFLDGLEIYHPDVKKGDRELLKKYNVDLHTGGSDTHYKHGKKLNLKNLYLTDIFNKNK